MGEFNTFLCPECGYPQYCGCAECKDKIPNGFNAYKWNDKDELICVNCGFKAHINWWSSESVKQFKAKLLPKKQGYIGQ